MPVYTVHARVIDGAVRSAPDRFVFVRDGFHVWAAVAGALWLAVHRLWVALLGYVAVMLAAAATLWLLRIGSDARLIVMMLIAVLMGFEAASLQRWTLSRGKWRQLDVVVAEDREAAERRFFDRWNERHPEFGDNAPTGREITGRGIARPHLQSQPQSHGPQSRGDVMGLFPQPGASR